MTGPDRELASQLDVGSEPPAAAPGWLTRVVQMANALGTLGIAALMLLINLDVLGRVLFDAPLPGTVELVSLSIVAIVFLQLADALRCGRVMRSDALFARLHRARPRLALKLQLGFHLVGAALFAVVAVAVVPSFLEALRWGEFIGALGHFIAPVWPVKAVVILGSVLVVAQFLSLARADRVALRSLRTDVEPGP